MNLIHVTKSIAILCAVLATASLTGCATAKVHSEHDASVDFSSYKTFAVLPISTVGPGVEPGAIIRIAEPAEQAIRDSLNAKGLTEAARGMADFAVLIRGESLPRIEVSDWGYTAYPVYGMRRRGWVYYGSYPAAEVTAMKDQKLILEIYDNASHKQAWVGWIQRSGNGSVEPESIRQGINKILQGFPPKHQAL